MLGRCSDGMLGRQLDSLLGQFNRFGGVVLGRRPREGPFQIRQHELQSFRPLFLGIELDPAKKF